jgi:hypothetical protein
MSFDHSFLLGCLIAARVFKNSVNKKYIIGLSLELLIKALEKKFYVGIYV